MRKTFFLLIACAFLARCGVSKKNAGYSGDRQVHIAGTPETPAPDTDPEAAAEPPAPSEITPADAVVETALTFTGVRYRYGGTNRKGMDCSGLLYTAFLQNDIALPRTSEMLSEEGKKVQVKQVRKGDLLFFKTRRGRKINHVGLVVAVRGEDVKFIHSTTSRGVIVSSLREGYWNHAFVKATRLF